MRISGGAARGISLTVPKGDAVRPATDGLRQAVFSSVADRVPGAYFLDLFAGSGAYGLEALSRGAAGGIFVEKSPRAVDCLRRNLAAVCKSLGRDLADLEIRQAGALNLSSAGARVPDLVFVDPPYELIGDVAPKLFQRLAENLQLPATSLVLFELPGELTLSPAGWTEVRRIGKGAGRQPTVSVLQRSSGVGADGR